LPTTTLYFTIKKLHGLMTKVMCKVCSGLPTPDSRQGRSPSWGN
jgi:hypothetical protein